MEDWKRNLAIVWTTQFLSIMAFQLGLPLMPFYIQELGITDPEEVKLWTGVTYAASFIPLAVMAPIWGMLADRFGRKLMMLRANFSATVILLLMAFAPNVESLVVLRFMQGFLTGTVTAAQVLVASNSPPDKQGMAIGAVSSAIFTGSLVGATAGGLLAEAFGLRVAFLIASIVMLVSASLVFLVKERFTPPEHKPEESRGDKWRERRRLLGAVAPILLAVAGAGVIRMYDSPMLPLLVQELHGQLDGAAAWTGFVNGVSAVAATCSAILLGRLSDRQSTAKIARISLAAGAVFMGACAFVTATWMLLPTRFGMILFLGGLDPMLQAWVARETPEQRRGFVMGVAVTARAGGWFLGPMIATAVAYSGSMQRVYMVGPFLLLALVPLISYADRRMRSRVRDAERRILGDA